MVAAPQAGHGLTSARIRRYHHRIVLQRLRRLGEASKADLARAAQLTNTAIGQIVADLQAMGLVSIVGKRYEGQRGQPATILRLEPTGAYGIGVRLDRDRIETALVDLSGRLVDRRSHRGPLPAPEEALALIGRDVVSYRGMADDSRVLGIGLARPFNIGSWLDRLDLHNPELALWDAIDFRAALAAVTGLEVHEENDGTAAAIAELFYGFGRENQDFLYLFLGAAIGGGVILDGDYRHGLTGNAGDVAMMPVPPSRLPSAPAPRGSQEILLARASLSSLIRHLAFHGERVAGPADLPRAIAARGDVYREWLIDCVEAMSGPILSAKALLDVAEVVIDGDLGAEAITELMTLLEPALSRATPEARTTPRLTRGTFGTDAHALGAASLPLFMDFAPRAAVLDNSRSALDRGGADARLA